MNVSTTCRCRGPLALFIALSLCVPQVAMAARAEASSGTPVSNNGVTRHPYMASILKSNSHHCTGVLLMYNVVLTAAHCVDPRRISRSQLKVRLFLTSGQETMDVSQIKMHPAYQGRGSGSNLALLKIVSSSSEPNGIRFSGQESLEINPEEKLLFLGWGRTSDSSQFSPQLQKTALPALNQDVCTKILEGQIHSGEFCAGAEGKGPCPGDDGGPLLQLGSNVQSDILVGIATSQLACGAFGRPDLFTGIRDYENWLSLELNKL